MTQTRTTGRIRGRVLLATALLTAAVAVPSAAAAPAVHTSSAPPSAPTRSGGSEAVYDRVAHFYGAYIDVTTDAGRNTAAKELRSFYLTPGLRSRLATWENRNHADGVLRAQDVPRAWRVTAGDSGMGHTWTNVRLTWGSAAHPTYTYLVVQSDLATKKISDIKPR
ncbi:hypothetical protein ACWCP6_14930 [Streptomyces sp. NPDC002004]